jgi:hypothetical protein
MYSAKPEKLIGATCMLFIHQQIQSFLNLGGCKEYSIMAKPKLPKKINNVKDPVPAATLPVPTPDLNLGAEEVLAATTIPEPKTTEPRKIVRKPEIVKSEPRANLIPINLEEEIRRLAYLLSERRGFQPGHEAEDWLTAEREVRQRYHQQSA